VRPADIARHVIDTCVHASFLEFDGMLCGEHYRPSPLPATSSNAF